MVDTTGENRSSYQQALIDVLKKNSAGEGFFHVANLYDRARPVTQTDVEAEIFRAERILEGHPEK
jgi:hypothetical protein